MTQLVRSLGALLGVLSLGCGAMFDEMRPDPGFAKATSAGRETILLSPRGDHPATSVSPDAFLAFMNSTLPHVPKTEEEIRAILLENWQAMLPRHARSFHLVQASLDTDPLVDGYHAWCASRRLVGDCSGALRGKSYLDAQGRYQIAFDIALGAEWAGFMDEMRGIGDPANLKVMLLGAMVLYMATLAIPELVTKFVAAAITVVLTAYLGAQTVWELVFGWVEMVRAADRATTFADLYAAGERYGIRVGAQIARVLVMVVTAAIAEGGLVARALKLPQATSASMALARDSGGRLSLAGVGQVRGASVAAGGVTVVVIPAAEASQAVSMAMAARGTGRTGAGKCREENHHIATVENEVSTLRGGPWTPRYQRVFARGGLSMEDAANKVRVWGHVGPHPQEYHELVFERLDGATRVCATVAICREKLIRELNSLGHDIATPGTKLNKLITRDCAPPQGGQ